MRRQSLKVKKAAPDFRAVYTLVDQRSEGQCEVEERLLINPRPRALFARFYSRCVKRATDHHHLMKPRRQHHQPDLIVHMCRGHHERCSYPFKRGRLVWLFPEGGQMREFQVRYAKDKFALRQPQAAS